MDSEGWHFQKRRGPSREPVVQTFARPSYRGCGMMRSAVDVVGKEYAGASGVVSERGASSVGVGGLSRQQARDDGDLGMGSANSIQGEVKMDQQAVSRYKRFVTFYFTNFPPQLSNFYLRKGFEVCGILEEVVVPSRRNVNGELYGFVHFSKVWDVGKLLHAVNAVCFGSYRVRAKLARFDRGGEVEGSRVNVDEKVGGAVFLKKCAKEGEIRIANEGTSKEGDGSDLLKSVDKRLWNGKGRMDVLNDEVDEGCVKVVRVGEVVVTIRDGIGKHGQGRGVGVDEVKMGQTSRDLSGDELVVVAKQLPVAKKLVRMFRANGDDLKWVRSGVLANVVNGEVITVVQNRIADAGFVNLDIIPLGADRVFLRSRSEIDILDMLGEAKDFFDHFFKNVVRCDKEVVPFRRGAWVRLYGIPIHAWKAISCVDRLVIDGQSVDIKIVEDWGGNAGEDACLFEEEDEQPSQSDNEELFRDPETSKNIDLVVDEMVRELEVEELNNVADLMDGVDAGSDVAAMAVVGPGNTLVNGECASSHHTTVPVLAVLSHHSSRRSFLPEL
ncbi:hypothetical protein MTR_0242s0010, partial [Medicago truncatula]